MKQDCGIKGLPTRCPKCKKPFRLRQIEHAKNGQIGAIRDWCGAWLLVKEITKEEYNKTKQK